MNLDCMTSGTCHACEYSEEEYMKKIGYPGIAEHKKLQPKLEIVPK